MMKNSEGIKILKKERRKRAELNLPNITFHQWENWRITLGKDVYDAWLTLYTLADRKTYPNQHVIQHWDYDSLAKKFCCGRTKAVEYIRTMYEYGLVEISETKNEKGGPKNIFIWCDIPFYSDTQYCDIYKARDWKDRKTEGQRRALAMLEAREISSSENELDDMKQKSSTSSTNSELEQKTSSKNELDTSTESELDNAAVSASSSTDSELDNQFRICTINNYTNNNNLNDMMRNESAKKNLVDQQQKFNNEKFAADID